MIIRKAIATKFMEENEDQISRLSDPWLEMHTYKEVNYADKVYVQNNLLF